MDAEKCFNKKWLKNSIVQLIKARRDINEAVMIYYLNKEADVMVDTSVGKTKEMRIEETVRKGSIYGPPLCCLSTD